MVKNLASIDIGSESVKCLIATINNRGKLNIKGASCFNAKGIEEGVIVDISLAKDSILKSIVQAEKIASKNINKLVVNINSKYVKSKNIKVSRNNILAKKITKKDICLLAKNISDDLVKKKKIPLHIIPVESIIDGNVVSNPMDMICNDLTINFYTMFMDEKQLNNIKDCFAKIGITIDSFVFNGYASCLSLLNNYKKNNCVLNVDIGADLTTFSVFDKNKFIFGKSIPMAGNFITKDLANVLNISYNLAEKIKILNTNFFLDKNEENEIIRIEITNNEEYTVANTKKGKINDIVKARLKDIFEIIFDILKKNNLSSTIDNIILTGGTANINGIDVFIANMTNKETQINDIKSLSVASCIDKKMVSGPLYTTAVGLLNFADLFYKNNKIEDYKDNNGIFSKVINFLINLFIS